MTQRSFQEYFPEHLSYCYGCGRLNEYGLQIKSYWDGDETVCTFNPQPYHIAVPGYVYGGLVACIIDCHCACTASAAAYCSAGREMGTKPLLVYLAASLRVDFLRPTPLGVPLEVRASVAELKGRKAIVTAFVSAAGEVCVRGELVAVQAPEDLMGE